MLYGTRLVAADTAGENEYVFDRASTCGNGALEADEDCDDGNLVDGDGCESDCLRTLCLGGALLDGGFVQRRPTGALSIKGRLLLPPGVPAVFDPASTGLQVALEDMTTRLSDHELSSRNGLPIPGGPGCDPHDGWLVRNTSARYLNRSGVIDPPTCMRSAFHLHRVRFRDRRATKGEIDFSLQADEGATDRLPSVPAGDLRVTVVIGGTAADGLSGACATRVFVPGTCAVHTGTLTCR